LRNFEQLWDKLFHPHQAQQAEIQNRLKELQELAQIALEIENRQIYKSLQTEMNELFMKYLTYVFFDGLRFIVPHLFLLAIITSKVKFIPLPVALPLLGNQVGIVILYPLMALLIHWGYKKFRSKKMQLN